MIIREIKWWRSLWKYDLEHDSFEPRSCTNEFNQSYTKMIAQTNLRIKSTIDFKSTNKVLNPWLILTFTNKIFKIIVK